jgi:tRNA dimethylallyltransferase
MKNPIIVLTGPTASGKTEMSLNIAKKYNCEIICADSMTVYQGMDIGTDKITASDMTGIPHHLLDMVKPDEEFNAAIFCEKAKELVLDIQSRGKIPMFVGGSVMYLDAYVYDYQMPEIAPNQELRDELEGKDNEELFKKLCECDPDCEWTVDRHNKRRIIRAIEICTTSGKPLAAQRKKMPFPNNVLYLAVDLEREELYKKIDQRVDDMFRIGFVDEVKGLHQIYDHNTAMQAAGYRQVIQFLDGEIDLETAIAKTKQVHRNYAKRQLTWLRGNVDVKWVKNQVEANNIIENFLNA